MKISDAHKIVAEAGGEMSLAIVRREADDSVIQNWIRRLRMVADGLEQRQAALAAEAKKET